MANIASQGTYSSNVVLTRVFYGQTTPLGLQVLLALGSQTLGFCLSGLLRQFVIWPSNMIWPGVLGNCAFLNTLHKNYSKHKFDKGHMTRKGLFYIAVGGSFVWCWVPSYLFTGLSMFNWVCWIVPKNVAINALFGTKSGLGMSVLTFDWGIIASLSSPLITPVGSMNFFFHAHCSH
jgi:hypothetical protein